MSKENKKAIEEKPRKLAFYISFKQSEEQLYKDMKAVDDYSNVLKGLMKEYLYGKNETLESKTDDKSIVMTVDDICKIISSVNPVVAATVPTEDKSNNKDDKGSEVTITDDPIPDEIVNSGL